MYISGGLSMINENLGTVTVVYQSFLLRLQLVLKTDIVEPGGGY